jgi:hypothetical protein
MKQIFKSCGQVTEILQFIGPSKFYLHVRSVYKSATLDSVSLLPFYSQNGFVTRGIYSSDCTKE